MKMNSSRLWLHCDYPSKETFFENHIHCKQNSPIKCPSIGLQQLTDTYTEQCLNRCDTFSFLALNLHAAIFIGIYIFNSSPFHSKQQRNLTILKHFKFVHETFHENSDTILKCTTKWHKYIHVCSLDVFIACKFIFSSCTAVFV